MTTEVISDADCSSEVFGLRTLDVPLLCHAFAEATELLSLVVPIDTCAVVLLTPGRAARIVAASGRNAARLVHDLRGIRHDWLDQTLVTKGPFVDSALESGVPFGADAELEARAMIGSVHGIDGIGHVLLLGTCGAESASMIRPSDKSSWNRMAIACIERIQHAILVGEQQLLIHQDPLTGLLNTRRLSATLVEMVRVGRVKADLAVLILDVDKLKLINSQRGHTAGTEALRRTGASIAKACAEVGTVFRYGGDEFIVLFPGASRESAVALATLICAMVASRTPGPMATGELLPKVTIAVGVATLIDSLRDLHGDDESLATRLFGAADRALHRAKDAGGDRVTFATRRDDRLL